MENLQRPSRNETDDDLLKQQEIFLKESKNPAAKFISHDKGHSKQKCPKNLSSTAKEFQVTSTLENDLEDVTREVVFDVKERDVSSEPFIFEPPVTTPTYINELKKKDVKLTKFAPGRNDQSIFAQLLRSIKLENTRRKEEVA